LKNFSRIIEEKLEDWKRRSPRKRKKKP